MNYPVSAIAQVDTDTCTRTTCSVTGFHPDDMDEVGSVGELLPNCEGKV